MKQILLILAAGFEEIEAAAFIDTFGWSRVNRGAAPVGLVTAGFTREIRAAHSLTVIPDILIPDADPAQFAAIALPGGFHDRGFTDAYREDVLGLLRAVHGNGGYVASVCVGARPVAEAGLLQGVNATTYPLDNGSHRDFLRERGAVLSDGEIVLSNRIVTCTGPGAALGAALLLYELLTSPEERTQIEQAMRIGKKLR